MNNRNKIIIFGASEKARRAYNKYKYLYNIIGFVDNDRKKWGSLLEDKMVYSPKFLIGKEYKILIASMYYKEIAKQLDEMKICNYKVFNENLQLINEQSSELQYKNLVEQGFYDSINEIKFMNNNFDKSLRSEFVDYINEKFLLKGANILEVDCGSGQFLMELGLRNTNRCIGLENNDENLKFASRISEKYELQNCEFMKYEDCKFNFRDKEFDIAFNFNVTGGENEDHLVKIFKEMSRVAKYVIIVSLNSKSISSQIYNNYVKELDLTEKSSLINVGEIEDIINDAGYKKLDSRIIGGIYESLSYRPINEVLMQNNIKTNIINIFEGKNNIGNLTMNVYSDDTILAKQFSELNQDQYLCFSNSKISLSYSHFPKISIVICFLNAENFINQLVNNLLCIEYDKLEFIFVNDGSTDNSEEILRKKIIDLRIINYKIISFNKNKGLFEARSEGVKNSTGEYILFQDVDDIIMRNGLRKLVNDIKNFDQSVLLNVSCALMGKCKFNSSFWMCKYLPNKIEYVYEETIELSGLVSLFHTLIKRDALINAYNSLLNMFTKLNVKKYICDEDTIIISYLVLNGYINKIIPIFYTWHGYECANESSVSKKIDITLRDRPIRIAYCMKKMIEDGIMSKSKIEKIDSLIKCKANEKFGDEFGKVFMENYNKMKNKINSMNLV